ncbi:hypothetical protein [Streptomyces sp. NPDC059402]
MRSPAWRVPLRPPVPPQRHDCPQLGRHSDWPQLRRHGDCPQLGRHGDWP